MDIPWLSNVWTSFDMYVLTWTTLYHFTLRTKLELSHTQGSPSLEDPFQVVGIILLTSDRTCHRRAIEADEQPPYTGAYSTYTQPMRSPSAAISGPPDSRMPISQSTRRGQSNEHEVRMGRTLTGVDDGDGHEDTGAGADRAHEVGRDGDEAKGRAADRSRGGDDALELLVHAALAVAGHDHLLLLELLRDVARARARHLDPRLREERAGGDHERHIDGHVHRVEDGGLERVRRRHVVRDAADGLELRRTLHRLERREDGQMRTNREEVVIELTSQTPRRRTPKLFGKRVASIWLTMKTLLVSADWSMIGMLLV
jgi:hypothetical protein